MHWQLEDFNDYFLFKITVKTKQNKIWCNQNWHISTENSTSSAHEIHEVAWKVQMSKTEFITGGLHYV